MRPKDQGTGWVRDIEQIADGFGLKHWRLAEQGCNDAGDLIVETPAGERVLFEAKCRSNLTVHPALEKAIAKSSHPSLPFTPLTVVLAWKRLVSTATDDKRPREAAMRRRQPGRPVAVLDLADLFRLLADRHPGRVSLRAFADG